jgi:hypothetical protein
MKWSLSNWFLRLAAPSTESAPHLQVTALQMCGIYYSNGGILVVSSHRQINGMCPSGTPASMLPLDAAPAPIGDAVLLSLRSGREGLTDDEAQMEEDHILKLAGEKKWAVLEKRWHAIHLAHQGDEAFLHILPTRQYQTGGYIREAGMPEYSAPLEPVAIGEIVRQIISEPPMKPVRHVPSHT